MSGGKASGKETTHGGKRAAQGGNASAFERYPNRWPNV